jgi:hypothetical protein
MKNISQFQSRQLLANLRARIIFGQNDFSRGGREGAVRQDNAGCANVHWRKEKIENSEITNGDGVGT